jgi:hypothetical protein
MTTPRRDRLALAAAGVAAVAGAAVFLASGNIGRGPIATVYGLVLAAEPIGWWIVGTTIVLRANGHRVGWLLVLAAAFMAVVLAGITFIAGGTATLSAPAAPWALLLVGVAYGPSSSALILAAMLLFPDGRLAGRRWRLPVLIVLLRVAASTVAWVLRPGPFGPGLPVNPIGIEALPVDAMTWLFALDPIGIVLLGLMGAASLVVRYLRGSAEVRAQLKWLIVSVAPVALITPISFSDADQTTTSLPDLLSAVALLLVSVAIGISILRYRLYEIDRLISRGVSWAVLTGLLVAVYAGAVLLLEGVLGGVTQGETVAVAASTLLAAALFQPLRRRVQSMVDHRFNRARYDAERTAASFAAVLRDEVELANVRSALQATVASAIRPHGVAVWIRGGSR